MLTLKKTFNAFAESFPIPAEERKKLFTMYVNTYTFAMGGAVKNHGEEESSSETKPEAGS